MANAKTRPGHAPDLIKDAFRLVRTGNAEVDAELAATMLMVAVREYCGVTGKRRLTATCERDIVTLETNDDVATLETNDD